VNADRCARILTLTLFPAAVLACTCSGEVSFEYALKGADLVFVGTVVGRDQPPRRFTVQGRDTIEEIVTSDMVGWVTLPLRGWKGQVSETLTVYSPTYGSSCGRQFEIGKSYLFFTNLESQNSIWPASRWPKGAALPAPTTYLCDRTRWMGRAQEDLTELGEPIWVRGDPDTGQPQNIR